MPALQGKRRVCRSPLTSGKTKPQDYTNHSVWRAVLFTVFKDSEVGIVIEVKYANDGNLEAECKKALKQIDDTGYAEALHQDGICKILKYAIACYKKTCKIMLEAEKC